MEIDLRDWREHFLDKEKTLSLVDWLVDIILERTSIDETKEQYQASPRFVIGSHVRLNFEQIHRCAASPIEKIFFNSLFMCYVMYGPINVMFTPPIVADTFPYLLRERYQGSVFLWEKVQEALGEIDLESFIDVLKKIESFDFDEHDLMDIRTSIVMYRDFGLYNMYHFSIQPTFKNIKVNNKRIKPDLFIWIPSKPDFKLIIECDGFTYHSTKEAFSRDRARDRLLQSKGYQVFRFSGQEIYNDPIGKSIELYDYLTNLGESKDEVKQAET